MASALLRPLSIGEILDGAFTVYRTKFTTLIGLPLLLMLPCAVLFFVHPLLGLLFQMIGYLLMTVATIWIVSEFVLGKQVTASESFGVAVRKAIPLIAASILVSFAVGLGMILLIIPGIIMWFMWYFYLPLVVIEDKVLSFGRSRELAKKAWGKIFLVTIVAGIIISLPTIIVYGAAIGTGGMDLDSAAPQLPAMFQSMSAILSALTQPFYSAVIVLLYYDQRVRKEGLDVELSTASIGEPANA